MRGVRPPHQAGRFYPESERECRRQLETMFAESPTERAVAAVAPHAGWIFSGATAAKSIAALATQQPETVVIFGAVHVLDRNTASLYSTGAWATPLAEIGIDEELGDALADSSLIATAPHAHAGEHSIEVELPLLQYVLPEAKILPIMVRPGPDAVHVGHEVARMVENTGRRVAYLASTDLTHYGPMFGYEPAGHGEIGVRWAKDVNDRRFIDLIQAEAAEAIVPEAAANRNACGSGAVAALLGAMQVVAHRPYVELAHTTSAECDIAGRDRANSVGYEAGVFPPAT